MESSEEDIISRVTLSPSGEDFHTINMDLSVP